MTIHTEGGTNTRITNQEPAEIVSSTGGLDTIQPRQDFRTTYNSSRIYDSGREIIGDFQTVMRESEELPDHENHSRRYRYSAVLTREAVVELQELLDQPRASQGGVPLQPNGQIWMEICNDLQEFGITDEPYFFVTLSVNNHDVEISEAELRRYQALREVSINQPPQTGMEVVNRLQALQDRGFQLTNELHQSDVLDLHSLWRDNFGWSLDQVISFVQTYQNSSNLWFCGVRDMRPHLIVEDQQYDNPRYGRLVAASMAEALRYNDLLTIIELTEWASEERGVSTAMTMALVSTILQDTYYTTGQLPLITAEMNLHNDDPDHLGAPVLGANTGLRQPGTTDNLIFSNVTVGNGRTSDTEVGQIGHFAYGALPLSAVQTLYTPEVNQIVNDHLSLQEAASE